MELLFIDESGDNGFAPGSTKRFILAGIAIRASNWKEYFWKFVEAKTKISRRYGIRIEEFKGSDLFAHRGAFFGSHLQLAERRSIYDCLIELLCDPSVNLFVSIHSKAEFRQDQHTLADKHLVRAFTERVWRQYLFDYDNFLVRETQRTGRPLNAIIYFDSNPGQEKYVRGIVREFARKSGTAANFPNAGIVEDIVFRDSKTSFLIQLADVLAFSVYHTSVLGWGGQHIVSENARDRLMRKIHESQSG